MTAGGGNDAVVGGDAGGVRARQPLPWIPASVGMEMLGGGVVGGDAPFDEFSVSVPTAPPLWIPASAGMTIGGRE